MTREELVELMVRRQYLKKGVNLPLKFWNLPEYKKDYQHQIRLAAKLFRTYDPKAISNVIEKETWCYSLATKKLANLIEIEQKRLALIEKQTQHTSKIIRPEATGSLFRKKEKKDFKANE
jgi:ribosomal 50S subunit-associated protein YjgA (DUF615 family)